MYDIIVVGGRCAGSSTAMLLARKGYRVLVVDRSTFPSDVLSTHFLWPHGASYLNRWGVLDRVLESTPSHTDVNLVNEGISVTGSVPEELVKRYFQQLHGDGSGVTTRYLSVRRRVLDKILVDAAIEAGVEFREGANVEELIYDDDAVAGVRYRTRDGGRVTERARLVVGADGRNSFLARALALPKYDERPRCTFAYWSYYEGFNLGAAQMHRRGRLTLAVVPTNFGQNMTLVFGPSEWASHFRRDVPANFQRAIEYVSPQIGEIVREQGQRTERFVGTLDQAAFLRPMYGNGWVLVGDAECFKDQCTAIGMTHAFRDAELAATALDGWLSGEEPVDVALKNYEYRRRSQTAAAYYDFVCTLAEMRPLRHDELQMFAMLRGNQPQTDLFIAAYGDVAPVSEFFDPSNLFLLSDTAKKSSHEHAVFTNFEDTYRSYQRNPFAETTA